MDFLDDGRPRRCSRRPAPTSSRTDAARPLRPRTWSSSGSGRRPRRSRSTPRTPSTTSRSAATGSAFGSVASAPNVADLDRGRRVGNRADYQNLIRLCQMLNVGPLLRRLPGRADRHPRLDPPPDALYDLLTLADKPIHCLHARAPAHHSTRIEMARIARGIDQDDARSRAVAVHGHQLELAAPARHADAPRHPRDVGAQPGHRHDAVHARRRDGAGDARGRARRAERRGARRDGPDPGRPAGRAGRLRRVHLERRHAVGRAGVRDAGVHADRDDRRPARAALRRARIARPTSPPPTRSTPRPPTSRCSRCGARSWAGSTC